VIDTDQAAQSIQAKGLRYDVNAHYDHASALIKSIRGSDPDAALHWLAVMLTGGEDPRFICRRMAIFASEDIGLASPQALQMAAAAWTITERVGMPECQLTLSELVLYLATCPKSRTATTAIEAAMEDVRTTRSQPVPEHLRSGGDHTHPEGKQPPAAPGFLTTPKVYYHPSDSGFEAEISKRLKDSP
jgi:putative ATPase